MKFLPPYSRETKIKITKATGIILSYGVSLLLPNIIAIIAAKNNAKHFCKEPDHKAACALFKDSFGVTPVKDIDTNAITTLSVFSLIGGAIAFAIMRGCTHVYWKAHLNLQPGLLSTSGNDGSNSISTSSNDTSANCCTRLWGYTTRFFNYIAPGKKEGTLLVITFFTLTITGMLVTILTALNASYDICIKNVQYNAADPMNEPLCLGYDQSTVDLHPMQMLEHQTNDIVLTTGLLLGPTINFVFTIFVGVMLTCLKNRRERSDETRSLAANVQDRNEYVMGL